MKTCNRCGETKPLESFHLHPQMLDGRLNQCRVCRNAWMSLYRKQKGAELGWREAERKLRGGSRESSEARWRRRSTRKRTQRCECCRERDINRMRKLASAQGMEIDHIVPLARGGANCVKNIQFLPQAINRAKADKLNFVLPAVFA